MFYLSWFCQECCFYNLIETKALSLFFRKPDLLFGCVFSDFDEAARSFAVVLPDKCAAGV